MGWEFSSTGRYITMRRADVLDATLGNLAVSWAEDWPAEFQPNASRQVFRIDLVMVQYTTSLIGGNRRPQLYTGVLYPGPSIVEHLVMQAQAVLAGGNTRRDFFGPGLNFPGAANQWQELPVNLHLGYQDSLRFNLSGAQAGDTLDETVIRGRILDFEP